MRAKADMSHAKHQGAAMDRIHSMQRHFYDTPRAAFLLGRGDLVRGLDAPPGTTILEVGCGTARNLVARSSNHLKSSQRTPRRPLGVKKAD